MSGSRRSAEGYIGTDSDRPGAVECPGEALRVERRGGRARAPATTPAAGRGRGAPRRSSRRLVSRSSRVAWATSSTWSRGTWRRSVATCATSCHPTPCPGLSRPLPWRTRVRTAPTPDTISRRPSKDSSGGPAHHPGGPGAQPQGRVARPPARLPDRLHRAVRLGQVVPGLRHHLRRGAAALRRVALGVRAPVPRPDGQAGRRLHRGALPGGLDRPEVHLEEPPIDRGHHHRGLRLPPAALRPGGTAALPHLRGPDRAADAAADRRQGAVPRGGAALPGPGPGDPGPQGRVRRAVPPAPDPGVLPGPGQRRDAHPRRPAQARQAEEAHDRGRRRPAGGQDLRQAPAHRLGRDGAQPRRWPGAPRLRRPRRQGPRS